MPINHGSQSELKLNLPPMKAVSFEIIFSPEARTLALKIRGQY
jgi:hypothetical protein